MNAWKSRLDRVLGAAVAALLAAMVLNVLWQVFTRFALGKPSSHTEELARYLMIWLTLLGAAYGVGSRAHLAVDLLAGRLTARARRLLEATIEVMVLLFAVGVLVGGGSRLVAITLSLGQTSAALHVPLGWVYLAIPVSGACMAFYALTALVHTLRGVTDEAHPSGGLN